MYHIGENRFLDAVIEPEKNHDERASFITMLKRCTLGRNTVFVVDRGYVSYNTLAHVVALKKYFVLRVKDLEGKRRPGISTVSIRQDRRFDFLDIGDRKSSFDMSFRILRIKINESNYEYIVTNLPPKKFPMEKIKEIYHLRWGIETAFRDLKYTVDLRHFKAKKAEYIYHEILARLVLFNACSIAVSKIQIIKGNSKSSSQLSFAASHDLCKLHFRAKVDITPQLIEEWLLRTVIPVKPDRFFPRKMNSQHYCGY